MVASVLICVSRSELCFIFDDKFENASFRCVCENFAPLSQDTEFHKKLVGFNLYALIIHAKAGILYTVGS